MDWSDLIAAHPNSSNCTIECLSLGRVDRINAAGQEYFDRMDISRCSFLVCDTGSHFIRFLFVRSMLRRVRHYCWGAK